MIDFMKGTVRIQHQVDEKDLEKIKEIPFRDVKLCIVPQLKIETEMRI